MSSRIITCFLVLSTFLAASRVLEAQVFTQQIVSISGADWLAATPIGTNQGTYQISGIDGTPFTATVSATTNSNVTYSTAGFTATAVVNTSNTSVQTALTGLRNTPEFKDRVAWIELDIRNFDPADNTLSTFLGNTAFGVFVSNDSGLVYTTDMNGMVPFSNPISASVAGGRGTLRYVTASGVTYGQNPQATTLMFWNHNAIGTNFTIESVRFMVETQSVPEPSTVAFIAFGLAAFSWRYRRAMKAS